MAMNVKIVRLLNGDEIIGEILDENDYGVIIKNPVRIIMIPNKVDPTKPNIGLAPWAEFSEDKMFNINMNTVICAMTPVQEFVNQYNSMFGGIVTPSGSKLILPGT